MPVHGGNHVPIKEVSTLLMELVTIAKLPLVVNRFHATRPLSEEYSSPVLPMLIEVGGGGGARTRRTRPGRFWTGWPTRRFGSPARHICGTSAYRGANWPIVFQIIFGRCLGLTIGEFQQLLLHELCCHMPPLGVHTVSRSGDDSIDGLQATSRRC